VNPRTPSVHNHPGAKDQLCAPHTFSFGHVRQLEAVVGKVLARAWALGAGPGQAQLVIDVDSTICEVEGKQKQGAAYGYAKVLGYHPILATRADTGEIVHARMRKARPPPPGGPAVSSTKWWPGCDGPGRPGRS
jgi:Transposase DDE domain group 1